MKVKNTKRALMFVIFVSLFLSVLVGQGSLKNADGTTECLNPGFTQTVLDMNELSQQAILDDPLLRRLHTDYWLVDINESANTTDAKKLSYARKVDLNSQDQNLFLQGQNAQGGKTPQGQGSVLGARAFFPDRHANAYALIKPEAPLLSFSRDGVQNPFSNKGFIGNVSGVKSISSYVFGANYPYLMFVQLENEKRQTNKYFLGSLKYKGWRELKFENPNYLSEARKREVTETIDYPASYPFLKFNSFVVTRDADDLSGDFITYISWTKIVFDEHIPSGQPKEIDGESIWKIERFRGIVAYEKEKQRLRFLDDLIELERKKMNLPSEGRKPIDQQPAVQGQ